MYHEYHQMKIINLFYSFLPCPLIESDRSDRFRKNNIIMIDMITRMATNPINITKIGLNVTWSILSVIIKNYGNI